MAEKIVSPGVFTEEKDLSFLPQGIANIGAAFIGPTIKGPAGVPTTIGSYGDFVQTFGDTHPNLYLPYAAKEYLNNGGTLTVVRTLHDDGYKLQDPISIVATGSFGKKHIALLHPSQVLNETANFYNGNTNLFHKSTLASNASGSAVITVSGAYTVDTDTFPSVVSVFSASFASSNANFLDKVFSKTPNSTTAPVYLYTMFAGAASASLAADPACTFELISGSFDFETSRYSEAETPWIISQTANNTNQNLFKFHTLSHGLHSNYEVKVAISNIKPAGSIAGSEYGSFTVTIRAVDQTKLNAIGSPFTYTDSDIRPNILESFDNVNLDPNSPRYIARVIGDRYREFANGKVTIYGDYSNKSKYVYVEVDSNVANGVYSPELVPFGFAALTNTVPKLMTMIPSTPATAASVTIPNVTGSINAYSYDWGGEPFTGSFTFKVNTNTGTYFFRGATSGSTYTDDTFSNMYWFELSGSVDQDIQSFVDAVNSGSFFTGVSASRAPTNGVKFTALTTGTSGNGYYVEIGNYDTVKPKYVLTGGADASGPDTFPSASFVTSQKINDVFNKRKFFGFDYDFADTDNVNYLKPLPVTSQQTTGSNAKFLLSNCTQDPGASFPSATSPYSGSVDLSSNTSIESRKFIVPFQGGSDAIQPNRRILVGSSIAAGNTQGYNLSSNTAADYSVYKNAIDAVSNPDEIDINMLVMPGVLQSLHSSVIDYAANMCIDRGDTFLVFDCVGLTANIAAATSEVAAFDNNYAATYYPWVKIVDANINKPVWVPPSVVIPGVLAFNDRVAAEWYAPAGLNRGGLTSVLDAYTRLTHAERDELYEGRINPIATFPAQGVCVWGQKTLQAKPSALDRINVRRLLIAVKKYIASATKYLVFENNTSATRNRFLNIVNPYLESVQQRQGLYAFRVVMDETNNTPDIIDRNIMYGQIFLQPTKTAEFIIIDFNILPTGAAFPGA